MRKALLKSIVDRKLRIAVIGQGYVGLPLALTFAAKGFVTYGIDTSADKIRRLAEGRSYITDVSNQDIARQLKKKTFIPSSDFALVQGCRAVIICVPTPIKRRYTPDISFILSAVRSLTAHLSPGTLVVLESTTYPGTTEELIMPELEKSGLKVGRDIFLAFSPERIDPGNATHTLARIPKVLGGVTAVCNETAAALYRTVIPRIHTVSSPRAAEMAKLLENTFRLINISWVNEAAMMCQAMHIDVWEAIDAAKTKPFGFMPFYPGLGVGGHCIPEDPIYLYWKARQKGFSSRFIKLSADINTAMPRYALSRVQELLAVRGRALKGARVLVLGVTYKKDVRDLRKSPAVHFIDVLAKAGVQVQFHDPLIPYLHIDGLKMEGVALTPGLIARQDCVVAAVDHSGIDYKKVLKHAQMVFDVKNIYQGILSDKIARL